MSGKVELKRCPFCGSRAEHIDFGPEDAENAGGSCIACTHCGASGPVEFGYKENFIDNWNQRSSDAQSVAAGGEVVVTDAMVESACRATAAAGPGEERHYLVNRDTMRAALAAALATQYGDNT